MIVKVAKSTLQIVSREHEEDVSLISSLTSRLSQSPGGTIYYKMTEVSDKANSKRAKMKMIKLSSKSLEKAIREVERRGLNKFEKFESNATNLEFQKERLSKQLNLEE